MTNNNYLEQTLKMILLSLIFVSCNKVDKIVYYKAFEREIQLKGNRVGPINYFKDPIDISLKDSLIIVVDDGKENGCLTLLNKNTFMILDSFGRKGKGPGEILSPDLSQKIIKDEILLTIKGKYYSSFYNLDSIISKNNYIPENKIVFPTNLVIPYNIMQVNDTMIIGQVSSGSCRIFKYNIKSNNYYLVPPNIEFKGNKNINSQDLGQILYSNTDYNSKNNTIVTTIRLIDQIDLLDLSTFEIAKSFRNSEYDHHPYEYSGQIFTDETMIYYLDVQACDDYIFGLYCGKNLLNATPNIGNELHIFDWNGQAMFKIKLDIGLSNILLADYGTLIGIDPLADQPLVIYNLKSFL